jgi:enoyl-[acyl-carrier protein] reductase II
MAVRTALCDLLGIEHPIMLAGMGGVSYAELCAAVSEGGGFGTLGMAGTEPEFIRKQMRRVRELTDKPFGVDLLAALPGSVEAAADIIIEEGASAFISGLGVPAPEVMRKFHDAGLKVITVCGTVRHALKAQEGGCDAVVAQGTEAGGHTGRVAGMALIPQVVDAVDIPVVAAGSIVDGRGLANALVFGAQGVWVGTRFIASEEGNAPAPYKQAIVEAQETDTIVTRCYSGKPMRARRNPYVDDWESRPQDILPFPKQMLLSQQNEVMGGVSGRHARVDPSRDCMPMGQGSGAIHDILPAAEIIRRMVAEAEAALDRAQSCVVRSGAPAQRAAS